VLRRYAARQERRKKGKKNEKADARSTIAQGCELDQSVERRRERATQRREARTVALLLLPLLASANNQEPN
jgi:hypothetical protein